ncbi:hypothetical protein N7507_009355 [Penicillium longicatenatum]|nr:hypothetical protein N7507_009355 [Penicillium longicatenatum]
MLPSRNILFFTNSELGQANVVLAVAEEFLHRNEFSVHIASYSQLAPLVNELCKRSPQPAKFHEIHGPCMEDLAIRTHVGLIHHKPGIMGTVEGFQKVRAVMSSWTFSEYGKAYQSCIDILNEFNPAVVVVDPILHVGLNACQSVGSSRVVILWPVPLKDVVILNQPNAGFLWKYPMTGSGYSYPLPWTLILPNMYLVLRAAMAMTTRSLSSETDELGTDSQGMSPFPLTNAYHKDSLHLTPAFREMDFPLHVPDNVVSCGPILRFRGHQSLLEKDPEMAAWLTKPTILISLGSHVKPTEDVAIQMAQALQSVLNNHTDHQALWKLRYDWKISDAFQRVLGTFIDAGSVRIVPWIQSDIIDVLETGKITVYVHHGGANSYFEACKVGVPQVILPQWLDTYDCATRVEWLGIGLHGSRKAAPGVDAVEFSQALETVLQDKSIHAKAAAMRDICKTEGRVLAHDKIANFAL